MLAVGPFGEPVVQGILSEQPVLVEMEYCALDQFKIVTNDGIQHTASQPQQNVLKIRYKFAALEVNGQVGMIR